MKKYTLSALIAASICGCGGQSSVDEAVTGYLFQKCANNDQNGAVILPVEGPYFGSLKKDSVCVLSREKKVGLGQNIRIIPYKNGLADLEFSCNKEELLPFLRENAGRQVIFSFGGKAVGSAEIPKQPAISRCALLYMESLERAVATCEKLSPYLKFDGSLCLSACNTSDASSRACVMSK